MNNKRNAAVVYDHATAMLSTSSFPESAHLPGREGCVNEAQVVQHAVTFAAL